MTALEARIKVVTAKYDNYLKLIKSNTLAAQELLKNLGDTVEASKNLQCLLNRLIPFEVSFQNYDKPVDTRVLDYNFRTADNSNKIQLVFEFSNGDSSAHEMSAKLMAVLDEAVVEPAIAAALIATTKKDFYKKYRPPAYCESDELYVIFQAILTRILTT